MFKIKQQKFIWFGIIVLGVILLGMPSVYAQDVLNALDTADDGSYLDQDNYDAGTSDFDEALGSTTQDFVFTPVTPCTIVDTRIGGGGFIPAGNTRSYNVYGNLGGQGGGTCTSPVGEPTAVLLNVVAVEPNGKGNLNVVPYGVYPTSQAGLSVNFNNTAGTNLANAGVVKSTLASAGDISLSANYSGCHAFITVLGYFSRPGATKLDEITNPSTEGKVPAGGYLPLFSPACPSGYTVTGGGCHFFTINSGHSIQGTRYGGQNKWLCDFLNSTGSVAGVEVHAICRRVPGR